MDPSWPREFKTLLKDCWSGDPSLRPDVAEVETTTKNVFGTFCCVSYHQLSPVITSLL